MIVHKIVKNVTEKDESALLQSLDWKRKSLSLSLDLVLKWIHGSLIFLWDSPNLIQKSTGDFHFTEYPENILKWSLNVVTTSE